MLVVPPGVGRSKAAGSVRLERGAVQVGAPDGPAAVGLVPPDHHIAIHRDGDVRGGGLGVANSGPGRCHRAIGGREPPAALLVRQVGESVLALYAPVVEVVIIPETLSPVRGGIMPL